MSSEFALVCACVAWPPSPARTLRIRAAAQAACDPEQLVRVARRHGVSTLVAEALRTAGVAAPPPLARSAARGRRRALEHMAATIDLQGRFDAAAIPTVMLKGVALSQRLFGSPLHRIAADIDLMVPRADIVRAWGVLEVAGYVTTIPRRPLVGGALGVFLWAAKDSQHRHRERGVVVELHWRLFDEPTIPVWAADDRQTIRFGPGAIVQTLGDDALFVYLCVHGASHLWARLKWLVDIAALVAGSPDGGAHYWEAAQRAGAGRAAASALMLAGRLFKMPLPAGFAAPDSWRLRLLNRLALRVITVGGAASDLAATPYRGWAEMLAKMLVASSWRTHAAIWRRIAISSEDVGELAFGWWRLFLYPLVRMPMMMARRRRRAMRRTHPGSGQAAEGGADSLRRS